MPDIQAVVTDLDGTVVDSDRRVSAATVRAANGLAARGIPLVVATARTPLWVAALEPLVSHVTTAVCCGGAVGWSPSAREMLWQETIPPAAVTRVVRLAVQRLADAAIAAYDGEKWRVTEAFATSGPARRGPVEIVTPEEISRHPVCAMTVYHPGTGLDSLVRDVVAGIHPPPTVARSGEDMADFAPAGTDKAGGVMRALAGLGVAPAHAIAFGDMPNDLPMFALCGYSVAVANAHPDVIAAAKAVAACVHDDGFARTLGELGLAGRYRADDAGSGPRCTCQDSAGQRPEKR